MGASRGLLAEDRPDTIDAPVERGHDADARALRACHKVGISEIEALHLVQLDSSLEERAINDADGAECEDGPQRLGYLETGDLVVRLQYVRDLSEDEIRQQQLLHLFEVASRQPGLRGWIPGEVPDKHVRIDEGRRSRP